MLESRRLYLRRLERTDLERSLKWINTPEIMIMMGSRGPRTAFHQEKWFESVATSQTNIVLALCQKEDHRHIGNLSLFNIDYIDRNAGMTIFIADSELRGKKYGPEATWLLLEYAFDYLNLNKVYAKTDNPGAARMYEKLGFIKEGVLRQQSFQDGEYVDKIAYGILRSEFDRSMDYVE